MRKVSTAVQDECVARARVRQERAAYIRRRAGRDNIDDPDTENQGSVATASPSEDAGDGVITVSVKGTHGNDLAARALDRIRLARDKTATLKRMKAVVPNPCYAAWWPVRENFFVPDIEVEHYRPYFGETKKQMELAESVYQQMLRDADGPNHEYFSDGEVTSDGKILPSEQDDFNYLAPRRTRAAERYAILEITRQYGTQSPTWFALAAAFGMNIRRVKLVCDVAEKRDRKSNIMAEQKTRMREQAKIIKNTIVSPKKDVVELDCPANTFTVGTLDNFCFTCHTVTCALHSGENVEPIIPIRDYSSERRVASLNRRTVMPCSQHCFLLPRWQRGPRYFEEGRTWTNEEMFLMREGSAIFRDDACCLSVVIGTKSCREVYKKMSYQSTTTIIRKAMASSLIRHTMPPASQPGDLYCTNDRVTARANKRPRGRRRKRALKSSVDLEKPKDDTIHTSFIPCYHTGTCSRRNGCRCAIEGVACQSTCGCNYGRYGETSTGVAWIDPTGSDFRRGRARPCKLRTTGCTCQSGHCSSKSCDCYSRQQVCSPDRCLTCGCDKLPRDISIDNRQCRNVDLITARHKKTVIGRSVIHGFGLFAGNHFSPGDLVGHYSGRAIHPEQMDKVLRLADAERKTYAFNLTDKMCIDGGCFGGKVRLINHSSESGTVNCQARFERIRGEGRIAIKAIKRVKPGEEFLFDYKITEGEAWMNPDSGLDSDDSGVESESLGGDFGQDIGQETGEASQDALLMLEQELNCESKLKRESHVANSADDESTTSSDVLDPSHEIYGAPKSEPAFF